MAGTAAKALKDVAQAEARLAEIADEIGKRRLDFEESVKTLRDEEQQLKRTIRQRLEDASREHGLTTVPTRSPSKGKRSRFDKEAVIDLLRTQTEPVGAVEIRDVAGVEGQALSNNLSRMVQEGELIASGKGTRGRKYSLPR